MQVVLGDHDVYGYICIDTLFSEGPWLWLEFIGSGIETLSGGPNVSGKVVSGTMVQQREEKNSITVGGKLKGKFASIDGGVGGVGVDSSNREAREDMLRAFKGKKPENFTIGEL